MVRILVTDVDDQFAGDGNLGGIGVDNGVDVGGERRGDYEAPALRENVENGGLALALGAIGPIVRNIVVHDTAHSLGVVVLGEPRLKGFQKLETGISTTC